MRNGESYPAKQLLANQTQRYFNQIILDGVRVNVTLQRLEGNFLLVTGTFLPKKLFSHYRYRWSIEPFFQRLKKRRLHLEYTHLKDIERLKKLMAIVALAFVFCWQVGLHYHYNTKNIVLKNHGYKANSFFRKGVDLIRSAYKFIQTRALRLQTYINWLVNYAKINTT